MNMPEYPLAPWQQQPWRLLKSYIKQARIPHALLIAGAKGSGKHYLIKKFAHSLLCLNPKEDGLNCGVCDSCALINADTHPDFIYIQPEAEKNSISISQLRKLVANAYLKPQFEKLRFAIIYPADMMTASAANAFLKCLEEPTERTIFVLITDKPNKLPATISSRCQKIKLTISHDQATSAWLKGQGVANNQETLINLAVSSLLSFTQLKDNVLLQQRLDSFNDWLSVARQVKQPALISENWLKYPKRELINWLISWVSDLIKCRYGIRKNRLINQDMDKALYPLAQGLSLIRLYEFYDLLLSSRERLETQLNDQIMLDEILVQWQALNGRT